MSKSAAQTAKDVAPITTANPEPLSPKRLKEVKGQGGSRNEGKYGADSI